MNLNNETEEKMKAEIEAVRPSGGTTTPEVEALETRIEDALIEYAPTLVEEPVLLRTMVMMASHYYSMTMLEMQVEDDAIKATDAAWAYVTELFPTGVGCGIDQGVAHETVNRACGIVPENAEQELGGAA